MAVSKVEYDGHTLIDLTQDTAVESDVAQGKYFHKADGTRAQGTATGGGGSATFTRHITLTFTTVDGTIPADILVTYRGADATTPQNVVWKSLTPDQVETEPGYFDYECEFDLVPGLGTNQADGAYIAVGGGCSLDASQTPELIKFIERSNNTDLFYVIFPTSTNTFALALSHGSYTPSGTSFPRTVTVTVTIDEAVGDDVGTETIWYRGIDPADPTNIQWLSHSVTCDNTPHTFTIALTADRPYVAGEDQPKDGIYISGPDGSTSSNVVRLVNATYGYLAHNSQGDTGTEVHYFVLSGSTATIELSY